MERYKNNSSNIYDLHLLLNECEIYEEIGKSRLGYLYRIYHPKFGECVLKYLKFKKNRDEFFHTFLSPLEKIKDIVNPYLGKIFEVNKENLYIIRELVLGHSLKEKLRLKKTFPVEEATKIIIDIGMALLTAHTYKIVYRNLKPNNIIVTPNNEIKIVDISLPPTDPFYIAPEVWEKKKSDIRSDIFSLGIIYYELLTGRSLLEKVNLADISSFKIIKNYIKESNLSYEIKEVLELMLEIDLNKRIKSPLVLISKLREILKDNKNIKEKYNNIILSKKLENTESEKEVKDKKVLLTGMMLSFSKEEIEKETQESKTKEKEEREEENIEEIYITHEMLRKNLLATLEKISYIKPVKERKRSLPIRIVYFPKGYENIIIQYLQKIFRRECWLLKESNDSNEMELEIDLEQAYILQHFYYYEDKLYEILQENKILKNSKQNKIPGNKRGNYLETINLDEKELITLSKTGIVQKMEKEVDGNNNMTSILEVKVNYNDAYQTMGWVKFCREHNFKKGIHFEIKKSTKDSPLKIFQIYLDKLESYAKEHDNIRRIKEFFYGDYDISQLDSGGMGLVFKLTAKNDPTILSLRPENYWAKKKFSDYLKIVKDKNNREIVYAEIPKGTEFVVKVAFEGQEEFLIKEAYILSWLAEDPLVCDNIIGAIQQGRFFSLEDEEEQNSLGYYLMLEYASEGNAEQVYKRFPQNRLIPSASFVIMYYIVKALRKLKKKGIIHRDIKPQNILLDKDFVPKLTDFGLALVTSERNLKEDYRIFRLIDNEFLKITTQKEKLEEKLKKLELEKKEALEVNNADKLIELEKEIFKIEKEIKDFEVEEEERVNILRKKYKPLSVKENANLKKFVGSVYYSAPEQLYPEKILNFQCDIYQLGAVMYTLLTGKRPVEGKNHLDTLSKVLNPIKPQVIENIEVKFITPYLKKISDLIYRMMAYNPEDRPTIEEVSITLEKILFSHKEDIKNFPLFSIKNDSKLHKKVDFAFKIHKKCIKLLNKIEEEIIKDCYRS